MQKSQKKSSNKRRNGPSKFTYPPKKKVMVSASVPDPEFDPEPDP
jgi:hypothetical protein